MFTLTELCQELRNWFDRGMPKYFGDFKIRDGSLVNVSILDGQYYRIVGSVFNNGVHKSDEALVDEDFHGAVWAMAIPPVVIALSEDIGAWMELYGGVDSQAMSPYNSESFGGYSYSKSTGGASSNGGNGNADWKAAFADRLNRWRKI